MPLVVALALAAFLLQFATGYFKKRIALAVVEGALLTAVADRALLLALLDTFVAPALDHAGNASVSLRRLLPAHVLLAVFCVLAITGAVRFLAAQTGGGEGSMSLPAAWITALVAEPSPTNNGAASVPKTGSGHGTSTGSNFVR